VSVGKAGTYPRLDQLKRTSLGSLPFLQTLDQAGKACQGQHSSLLQKLAIYDRKKFYNIGPSAQCYKTFYIRNLQMFVIS